MGQHFVKVVEDGTLAATRDGWACGMFEDTNEICFVVEQTAVQDEEVLTQAWSAAKQLVIEQAVRDGIVEYVQPPRELPTQPTPPGREPWADPSGGRRVAL